MEATLISEIRLKKQMLITWAGSQTNVIEYRRYYQPKQIPSLRRSDAHGGELKVTPPDRKHWQLHSEGYRPLRCIKQEVLTFKDLSDWKQPLKQLNANGVTLLLLYWSLLARKKAWHKRFDRQIFNQQPSGLKNKEPQPAVPSVSTRGSSSGAAILFVASNSWKAFLVCLAPSYLLYRWYIYFLPDLFNFIQV